MTDIDPTKSTNQLEIEPLKCHEYEFSELITRYHGKIILGSFQEKFSKVKETLGLTNSDNVILAGGALRSILLGKMPKTDWDFFFTSAYDLDTTVSKVRAKNSSDIDVHYSKDRDLDLPDGRKLATIIITEGKDKTKIQLIHTVPFANPTVLLDTFDFSITQFALSIDGETLTVGEHSLFDLARKRLSIHRVTYGVATLRRMFKYTKYGLKACNGTYTQLLKQIASKPGLIREDVVYVD